MNYENSLVQAELSLLTCLVLLFLGELLQALPSKLLLQRGTQDLQKKRVDIRSEMKSERDFFFYDRGLPTDQNIG